MGSKQKYIYRIAHFESLPFVKVGDTVPQNTPLGKMGLTGQTSIIHNHIDTIRVSDFSDIDQFKDGIWRSSDYENGLVIAAPEQTDYLIGDINDHGLYGCERKILHCYHDSGYTIAMKGKRHWGTDTDSTDPYNRIAHHNRSFNGICVASGFDKGGGYGFYVCIGIEI